MAELVAEDPASPPVGSGDAPRATVVVPTRNAGGALRRSCRGPRRQTLPRDRFEVVIADDGSEDGSTRRLESADGWLTLSTGPPQNSYAARNRAATSRRGAALAFCDRTARPSRNGSSEDWWRSSTRMSSQVSCDSSCRRGRISGRFSTLTCSSTSSARSARTPRPRPICSSAGESSMPLAVSTIPSRTMATTISSGGVSPRGRRSRSRAAPWFAIRRAGEQPSCSGRCGASTTCTPSV